MESIIANLSQGTKLLIKAFIIGGLALLLLIPTFFVGSLVKEREERQQQAFKEVSGRWAGRQNIAGPVLVLPYADTPGVRKMAYFLPDELKIDATATPEERHRGIYQVMLYSSAVNISGRFDPLPLEQLGIDVSKVLWNQAYVCISLSDAKGLRDQLRLKWNNQELGLSPASLNNGAMREGFTGGVSLHPGETIHFSATIHLNGSEQLLFTPIGRQSAVTLSSSWPDPSFTGSMLPVYTADKTGFKANWKSMAHSRAFPQAWKDAVYQLESAAVGADLFIPVNGYQKTMRSVKYAILCILLTFASFFIIETIHKKSVHPLQYALIGLALVLFYTLLLSISEYTGFNIAYIIASAATVTLISWFVRGVLQSSRLSAILGVLLVLLYSYLFTILQLQDYSLILGSIGLFVTLAVIMHFSRKIQW
jgi:inner membrane protein